jgi:hypothetical protein
MAVDSVNAHPTKQFFVQMLVRDIELAPAIIDLLDNSIDGAKRVCASSAEDQTPSTVVDEDSGSVDRSFEDLWVRINLGPEGFEIIDNCGGITREEAKEHAFRFGRPEEVDPTPGEVGQFGVGMKRALFKIGKHFLVATATDSDRFKIDVDVPDWLKDPDNWTFPLDELESDAEPKEAGTRIWVNNLHESVASTFSLNSFETKLRAQIAMRHAVALERGLKIFLGDSEIEPKAPVLLLGDEIAPIVTTHELGTNGDAVTLHLYAGFVNVTDEDADTGDPEQFRGSSQSGWYLFCNDRMLLWANQSALTGWGEEVARYHPQYRRFRGYALLSGKSEMMPWNTAKTYVDEDSPIWIATRQHMVNALRDCIKVLNRVKRETEQRPPDDRPLVQALKQAEPVRLAQLAPAPKLSIPPPAPKIASDSRTIRYAVPVGEYEEVAESLGVSTVSEVGRKTFYYFKEREVDA